MLENAKNLKTIQLRSDDNISLKNFGKMHKFWSLGLEFQVSVSEFLMKSRSRSFNQVSVSKVTVSTQPLKTAYYCSVVIRHI